MLIQPGEDEAPSATTDGKLKSISRAMISSVIPSASSTVSGMVESSEV
ncbi:hypothetical protein O0544_10760 [Edwardsiella anguillarum]|nr:hypothetical protein [Edwardsiella anguillarum]